MTDRLLKFEELPHGLGRTKTYDMIAKGEFPQPVKIGTASRWSEAEVNSWIAERKKQRVAA
jgi:prophage regulatory protein